MRDTEKCTVLTKRKAVMVNVIAWSMCTRPTLRSGGILGGIISVLATGDDPHK